MDRHVNHAKKLLSASTFEKEINDRDVIPTEENGSTTFGEDVSTRTSRRISKKPNHLYDYSLYQFEENLN